MESKSDTLFPMPPPSPEEPLELSVGDEWHNYKRYCKGQEMKVMLRDLRTGKVAATVYGGKKMAQYIADCVNSAKRIRRVAEMMVEYGGSIHGIYGCQEAAHKFEEFAAMLDGRMNLDGSFPKGGAK